MFRQLIYLRIPVSPKAVLPRIPKSRFGGNVTGLQTVNEHKGVIGSFTPTFVFYNKGRDSSVYPSVHRRLLGLRRAVRFRGMSTAPAARFRERCPLTHSPMVG